MSLFIWIAVGTALAALLLGLILRAWLREDQVWEQLVGPNAPPNTLQSENQRDTDEHPNPQGEEMNTPIPMPTSRSPHDADLRRSSRIEHAVPLVVLATNRRGETFQEKTSAVAVNFHGCRYPSRHDYAPEGWVTLQVTGTDGANSPVVRARVRSVLSPQTPRELCQVGVELETPGNVWGIPAPPEDWQRLLGTSNSDTRAAAAVAAALEPSVPLSAFLERQSAPSERRAEITVFPGPPAAAAAAPEISLAKELPPSKVERVVVTAEQLLQALQGKIQLAANKAVQASLSTQLDEAVKLALVRIEDGGRANVRQIEEFSAARLAEVQNLWETELVVSRSRAEEISHRLEALTANSHQAVAETQRFLECFANETAPHLHARLNDSFGYANREFEARAAQVSEHHLAQLAERTQLIADEAHSRLDERIAEVRSLLSSAGGGVSQERVDSLLSSSREQILSHLEWRLGEVSGHYEQLLGQARNRADELSEQVEKLSTETRDHLAETRSLADRTSREFRPQDLSAIEQSVGHATKEFEAAAARVSDRQLVRLMEQKQAVSQEVSLELEARASEARVLLQKAANSTLEEFRRRVEVQIDLILAEAIERVTSSLASLDAESRAAVEARRRALEADVAHAAQQSTMEFRSGIKAFLYSCLVAAVSAVDQHAQTTLTGLSTDPNSLPRALDTTGGSSPRPDNPPSQPNNSSPSE